ncbi:NmrA family NAD(P)-binding protein [Mycobacterium sp. MYCO198283]|uniref:NmrA family NAD(P)-binding protein n=1 Tax=Mycobacterium sp. MYCO198283 TaxID=2883505 RepID=UPI001E5554C4|nr:NmrA family NAD(P)-binding protein [Mycobacterium sp. MYCO198283]MCG5432185.1 NmrA family NAD(P)-binding protein [Mycobacterium sp. MYCO198283]
MSEQKLIAVVGGTGKQGGGLVQAILDDPAPQFRVRVLTRSAQSSKARELAAAGAEVVEADLDDGASVRAAFDGADGAFVVTNYWAERSADEDAARTRADMERAQADNAALAAKQAGVGHVIWSTLEDTREVLGADDQVPTVEERYKVPHFDAKAEADALFREYDVPTTFLRTTFFFESFAGGVGPTRAGDGTLELTLPMADQPLSGIAVADIGKTALGIFKRGAGLIGQTVSIAGDHLTGEQYASAFSDAFGEPVTYRPMSWEQFRALGFPGAVEMANMFQYYAQNSARFVGARDLAAVRELNPALQSFRDWLAHAGLQRP